MEVARGQDKSIGAPLLLTRSLSVEGNIVYRVEGIRPKVMLGRIAEDFDESLRSLSEISNGVASSVS